MIDSDKMALIQAHADYVKECVMAALAHFHQVKSQIKEDLIALEGSPLRLDATLVDFNVHDSGRTICQLDFVVYYGSGASDLFTLSASGNGLSLDEAINQGIDQWAVGTVPVLIAAFGSESASVNAAVLDYLTGEKQNGEVIDPRQWKISCGPIVLNMMTRGGSPPSIDALREALKDDTGLFARSADALNILLQKISDKTSVLAVKIYLMRFDDGTVKGEFTINGTMLPELVDLLGARVEWIDTSEMLQTIRQFMVIQRVREIDPELVRRLAGAE